jgi:hypothetical protein
MTERPAKSLGIVLQSGSRRAVLMALHTGRQCGLRARCEVINQLCNELAVTKEEREYLHRRLTLAHAMLERCDQILAMRERCDEPNVTLH